MGCKAIFPDDIIVEILLKLPVKSILRCNTLSKHFYSIIHSQFFIHRHLKTRRINDNLYYQAIASPILGSVSLFDRRGHFMVLEDLPSIVHYSSRYSKPIIRGPVNGLYCMIDPFLSFTIVLNPATRERFLLPRVPRNSNNSKGNQIITRPFEEVICIRRFYACGLGYDESIDDYKVVLIYGVSSGMSEDDLIMANSMFYIMKVRTCEWRNLEQCFGVKAWNIKSKVGVFFRGACHWIYEPSPDSGYSILVIDMLTESNRIIAFPTVGDGYAWFDVCTVTFNGFLGLVNALREDNSKGPSSSFDVWVMDEYSVTESWTILYRVSLEPGIVHRFLGVVRNRFYVQEGDGWLVSYDLDSKDEERYDILDKEVRSLLPYEESLVRISK